MSVTNSGSAIVFLDPLRSFRITHMKNYDGLKNGYEQYVREGVRLSRFFVAASGHASPICDSDKKDLAEVDSKTRFFQALKRNWGKGDEPWNAYFGTTLDFVNEAVADMMNDDISHVTHRISRALDGIEPHLFDNDMLRSSTDQWREELGRWRTLLAKLNKGLGDGPVQRSPELLGAREKVDITSRRVEATFNALVGSNALWRRDQSLKLDGLLKTE